MRFPCQKFYEEFVDKLNKIETCRLVQQSIQKYFAKWKITPTVGVKRLVAGMLEIKLTFNTTTESDLDSGWTSKKNVKTDFEFTFDPNDYYNEDFADIEDFIAHIDEVLELDVVAEEMTCSRNQRGYHY